MAQYDIFTQLPWLAPGENPFGLRVLDFRPFSTTMISVTKDPHIAVRFTKLRGAGGEEHRSVVMGPTFTAWSTVPAAPRAGGRTCPAQCWTASPNIIAQQAKRYRRAARGAA